MQRPAQRLGPALTRKGERLTQGFPWGLSHIKSAYNAGDTVSIPEPGRPRGPRGDAARASRPLSPRAAMTESRPRARPCDRGATAMSHPDRAGGRPRLPPQGEPAGQARGGQHKGRRCLNKGDAEVRPRTHAGRRGW